MLFFVRDQWTSAYPCAFSAGRVIAYTGVGDVLVFVAGTEEYDELIRTYPLVGTNCIQSSTRTRHVHQRTADRCVL